MKKEFQTAENLLSAFKGSTYMHGIDVLRGVGAIAAGLGRRAALVLNEFPGSSEFFVPVRESLAACGVEVVSETAGAAPNAPREDVFRISDTFISSQPNVLISFGGGSTIDAVKAAEVLRSLGGDLDDYFGVGLVTKKLESAAGTLTPHIAIQTAASSAAHLTKYSNITDIHTGQKKLIVDTAIVPSRPVFDYRVTFDAPGALTADGALDGISHALEVLFSAVGKPEQQQASQIASEAIRLVIQYLPRVMANPHDPDARLALGLATDLGGYAIMVGGTNGAHLTSFSLVDILSHGRACGLMNPYYTVFFAPAVEEPLRLVGSIYQEAGYLKGDLDGLSGRALGMAVARAMIAFERAIGFPSRLMDIEGFTDAHIERALRAAKNPQLKMKLENMPVPMTADMVDEYMGPILQAAKTGDLDVIKNVK